MNGTEFPWFYSAVCGVVVVYAGWVAQSIFALRKEVENVKLKAATDAQQYVTQPTIELLRQDVAECNKLLHEVRGELRASNRQGA